MKHIRQIISGDKVIVQCGKCGEQIVLKISSRRELDLNLETFNRDHLHPGKSK